MIVKLIKQVLWIFVVAFSSPVGAGHGDKNETQISENRYAPYNGLRDFDAKQILTITLRISEKKSQNNIDENQFVKQRKGSKEKNEAYYKLAELLPAGTVFRIQSVVDTWDGDLEAAVAFEETLNTQKLLKNTGIVNINKFVYGHILEPERILIPIEYKKIPDGWNRDRGYSELIKLFNSGAELVTVSVVFQNPNNRKPMLPYRFNRETLDKLQYMQKGTDYGINYDNQNRVWSTQELDRHQADFVYGQEQVINLIPRDN